MKLQEFSYDLPQELIAKYPLCERDKARLMVVDRRREKICHDVFSNIGRYLPDSNNLVLNDSKVVSARLLGRREKTGGQVEIFLLRKLSDGYSYEALIRPLKRLKIGEKIIFNGNKIYAQLSDAQNKIVRFNEKNMSMYLDEIGHVPLPPYIKRQDEQLDKIYYQTVYAKKAGSVAAPTAGLHFTPNLLKRLKKEGHSIRKLTLHINYATFTPVREEDITKHKMHSEEYSISVHTYEALKEAKKHGQKIVAVGTTSCRVLETVSHFNKLEGYTDIFIYPGYQFKMTDILVTNFHLPRSTLLMLVYAFGTTSFMQKAYQEAIRQKYRFYSYGDAMMII